MYFSGIESKDITYDDPERQCMRIKPELYSRVENNCEQNTRVFLDTHLLKIRHVDEGEQRLSEITIPKSDASITLGHMPFIPLLIYVSDLLMKAEFKEISSDEFKGIYLAPLDNALKESDIRCPPLPDYFVYPRELRAFVEGDFQRFFDVEVASTIRNLYHYIGGIDRSRFQSFSILRSPLDRRITAKLDMAHVLMKGLLLDLDIPAPKICFAIGGYKKKSYKLAHGFDDLKSTLDDHKKYIWNNRQLRSMKGKSLFRDKEWSPRVLFALLLRKYLYQAFLCGTDRIFISDYETFSGFFKYDLLGDKMTIHYYIIRDPETVAHGITLRSAITGFFYKNIEDAYKTKDKYVDSLEVAKKTEGVDLFQDLFPRLTSLSSEKLSGNGFTANLGPIREKPSSQDYDEIHGNTYCRILFDADKCYPDLKLPTTVFVKLYHYSSRVQYWAESLFCMTIPLREDYYGMFFNEVRVNRKLAKSRYASNFPKLLVSGYWNGLPDHPMNIFEDLGEEVPRSKWKYDEVYKVIKLRLEEIHLLGISHNDVRLSNIHVSVSGKISLIDFGLSDCTNNEEHKTDDLKSLRLIWDTRYQQY